MQLRKGFIRPVWFAFFLLIQAKASLAQLPPPDPRDSLIIESKIAAPGQATGPSSDTASYLRVRVWITNKDTLYGVSIPMQEKSVSGGAYAILGYPRTAPFNGFLNRLTNTLSDLTISTARYNSSSPDSVTIAARAINGQNTEPPNSTRKPLWEIKFDSILSNLGTVQLDTVSHILTVDATFTGPLGGHRYNFVKSTITVCPAVKGDLNCDGDQRPEDVILMLYCVFFGAGNCELSFTDVDCDGTAGPGDVVLLLKEIFLDTPFPC